ncbi:unnamed protein product [Phaedon cochleariae]|uniref:Gustatory receptor n=1 Tax=Phaedon cochleariae TaxID=80249 RepID=A0A9N9WZN3_PHACE|nr:unnamed protein product [Phaedon cochleariae]
MVRKIMDKTKVFGPRHVDFKVLKLVFKLGKLFGTAPFPMETVKKKPILGKVISLAVIGVIISYNYFTIQKQIVIFPLYHTTITAMSWLITLTDIVLLFYCVTFLTFFRNDVWMPLFKKIHKLEDTINHYDYFQTGKEFILFFKLGLMYSTFIGINFARYYITSIRIIRVNSTISQFYTIIIFTYYISLTNWMKNRYDFLDQYLTNSMSKQQKSVEVIERVMEVYKLADSVVEEFNKLCGGIVSYCICVSVLHLLYYFSFAIDNNNSEAKILNYLEPLVQIVSLTVMIMSCDSTEKSGQKIIKTCFHLHDHVENFTVKEKLLMLANYVKQWKPVFSAAGFYDIHQTTLSSIFSAFITYSVIIIQFNMVLVDENTNSTDATTTAVNLLEKTTSS